MKGRWVLLILALLLLCGCNAGEHSQKPELILRYADNQPQDYPTTMAAEYFAQLVQQRTQGKICIRIYSNGRLGDENSVLEQVRFGGIDFTRVSLATLSDVLPDAEIFQLPYLYKDADHMWRVLDGKIGTEFLSRVRGAGVVGLSWFDAGTRSFYTCKPISTLEELQGLTIRVQESGFMSRMIELMGASAVQIPYGDVYSALQTEKIDGAENNWPSYESTGHFEAAPYVLLDEHCRTPEMQVMSTVAMDKIAQLDEDYVTIVCQCAKESAVYERQLWKEREEFSRNYVLERGCTVTELSKWQQEAFRSIVEPIYSGYSQELRRLIEEIQQS